MFFAVQNYSDFTNLFLHAFVDFDEIVEKF